MIHWRYAISERLGRADFAPINGKTPHFIHDIHPSGRWAAMGIPKSSGVRAAVWDIQTGAIVWAPEEAIGLCWLPDGQDVLLAKEQTLSAEEVRNRVRKMHDRLLENASPQQKEILVRLPYPSPSFLGGVGYEVLERWSWTNRSFITESAVSIPTGWFYCLTMSPAGNMAAYHWLEQDDSGFVLFTLAENSIDQVVNAGFRAETNLTQPPTFSPDGRFLTLSISNAWWWSPDEEPQTPAAGGIVTIGSIRIFEIETMASREIVVTEELPKGWLPEDPERHEDYILSEAIFLVDTRFEIELPTGSKRVYRVE